MKTEKTAHRFAFSNWFTALVLLLSTGNVYADTFYVSPGEDIQTVIDTATDGDTVLLQPGTHFLTSEISITNGIILGSVETSSNTVIDGNEATRCVYVGHTSAVIDDLTITRGRTTTSSGAGVYCLGGIVQNCLITSNIVAYSGDEYVGGGAYCTDSGILSNCVIRGNSASYGGGAHCANGALIQDCWIGYNVASNYGGGVYCRATVQNCVIVSNSASGGGGVYLSDGKVVGCKIISNVAGNNGGGVYACADVWNCTVLGNSASGSGGGVYAYSDAVVLHCTISENDAGVDGGGIGGYDQWWSQPSAVSNSIVYFNQAPTASNVFLWSAYSPYSYCCTAPSPSGWRNLSEDPLFLNRAAGDYRLSPASPCVDACPSNHVLTVDCDGMPRLVDGDNNGIAFCDAGSHEYQGNASHPTHAVTVLGSPDVYSTPWPLDYGVHEVTTGKVIVASVPIVESAGGTRVVCTGWSGSGSVPLIGETNTVTFTVSQSSTLTWNWLLQHELSFDAPLGSITGADTGYWDNATEFMLNFVQTNGYLFHHWEINQTYAGRALPTSIVMTKPLHVRAVCEPAGQQTNTVTFDPTPWPGISMGLDGWIDGPLSFENESGMGLRPGGSSTTPDNGTAYLTFGNRYGPSAWIRLKTVGTLSLISVDLAEYSTAYWEPTIHFIGHRADGGIVTNSFLFDGVQDGPGGVDDFQCMMFTNFQELVAIETPQGGFSLDNLNFVVTSPDLDGDGMDDEWERAYFGNCSRDGSGNEDGDEHTDWHEWLVGSDPTNANDVFAIHDCNTITNSSGIVIRWNSIERRLYTVYSLTNLTGVWTNVFSAPGNGSVMSYTNQDAILRSRFFRVGVDE